MELILSYLLVAVASSLVSIFVYRNNRKDIDPIASKVDEKWDDKVKPVLEKLEEKLEELKEKE